MKVNVLSRLSIVSKLNAKEYRDRILEGLGLGNHFFDGIQKEVDKYQRINKEGKSPKDYWAIYVADTFFTGSKKYLDMMKEDTFEPEEMEMAKDKESISRGLDEIQTLRSALNEKKLITKQKLKEFDDFVKALRDEIEESVEAKEAYMDEREEYLDDCEKHLKNIK